MHKNIVILGGGTGGTIMANRLLRKLGKNKASISVVDKDNGHVYQPGLLFIPFGIHHVDEIVRPRQNQLHDGIDYIRASVNSLDAENNVVSLSDGSKLEYDVLVIATGAELLFEETEGFTGQGWRENVFDFYTLEGSSALAQKMEAFDGGKLVVSITDMPIKCPVAPLEFSFLADWYFTEKGIRDKVDITFVTPLDGAFTRPVAAEHLGSLLAEKNINTETEFCTGEIDGQAGLLKSYCGREIHFDLLVATPLHGGPAFAADVPGLGDPLNFIVTNNQTMQSSCKENIFAIGDATNLPTSKAGSVTHFEAEVLVENLVDYLQGNSPRRLYDGHANCFVETGFNKAMLIDFNYEVEPLPGRFPFAGGPMALMKETRLNHIGKLMFQKIYWNALLPGLPLPGIPSKMPMSGKKLSEQSENRNLTDEPDDVRKCDS